MTTEKDIDDLWIYLDKQVRIVCKDRDPSHGHEHMKKVSEVSTDIFCEMFFYRENLEMISKVVIVSWLHDLADHKYDHDGTLKNILKNIIKSANIPFDVDLIVNIIDSISYSNEKRLIKEGKIPEEEWLKELGKEGLIVRNIVSDADKLEAIGIQGLERCANYICENNVGIDDKLLKEKVAEHAKEKLILLKDNSIRTKTGKRLAERLHQEMVKELCKY